LTPRDKSIYHIESKAIKELRDEIESVDAGGLDFSDEDIRQVALLRAAKKKSRSTWRHWWIIKLIVKLALQRGQ